MVGEVSVRTRTISCGLGRSGALSTRESSSAERLLVAKGVVFGISDRSTGMSEDKIGESRDEVDLEGQESTSREEGDVWRSGTGRTWTCRCRG